MSGLEETKPLPGEPEPGPEPVAPAAAAQPAAHGQGSSSSFSAPHGAGSSAPAAAAFVPPPRVPAAHPQRDRLPPPVPEDERGGLSPTDEALQSLPRSASACEGLNRGALALHYLFVLGLWQACVAARDALA